MIPSGIAGGATESATCFVATTESTAHGAVRALVGATTAVMLLLHAVTQHKAIPYPERRFTWRLLWAESVSCEGGQRRGTP